MEVGFLIFAQIIRYNYVHLVKFVTFITVFIT